MLEGIIKPVVNLTEKWVVLVFPGPINDRNTVFARLKDAGFKSSRSVKHRSGQNPQGWFWYAKRETATEGLAQELASQQYENDYPEDAELEVKAFWADVNSYEEYKKLPQSTYFRSFDNGAYRYYKTKRSLELKQNVSSLIASGGLTKRVFYTDLTTKEGIEEKEPQPASPSGSEEPATPTNPVDAQLELARQWTVVKQRLENQLKGLQARVENWESKPINTPKKQRTYAGVRMERDLMVDRIWVAGKMIDAAMVGKLPHNLARLRPNLKNDDLRWCIPWYSTNTANYIPVRHDSITREHPPKQEAIGLVTLEDHEALVESLVEIGAVIVADARRKAQEILDEIRRAKIDGFFPTPDEISNEMTTIINAYFSVVDRPDTLHVLEPSAGIGSLIDAALKELGKCSVTYHEVSPILRKYLKLKYSGQGNVKPHDEPDFLKSAGTNPEVYDVIMMNPPFEHDLDGKHIMQAWDKLAPGGILVAVCGEGIFFRSRGFAPSFREFLVPDYDESGWRQDRIRSEGREKAVRVDKLPDGAFKSGFNPTGVSTRLITLIKPGRIGKREEPVTRSGEDRQAKARKKQKVRVRAQALMLQSLLERGLEVPEALIKEFQATTTN